MQLKDQDFLTEQPRNFLKTNLDLLLFQLIQEFKSYLLKLKNQESTINTQFEKTIFELSHKEDANTEDLKQLQQNLRKKEEQVRTIYHQRDFL